MVKPMQIIFSKIWSMNLKAGLSVKKALLCFKVLVLLKFVYSRQRQNKFITKKSIDGHSDVVK